MSKMIKISSSWTLETTPGVNFSVQEIEDEESVSFLNLLEENNCCLLKPNNDDSECELTLSAEKKIIASIIVLSEAKYVEVYTESYKQYYSTFKSELLSDMGDSKIYQCKTQLLMPQNTVFLRLKNLVQKDSVFIFGVFVKLNLNALECDTFDTILKDGGIKLSANAKKFKETYEKFNSGDKAPNLKDLSSIFGLLASTMNQSHVEKSISNRVQSAGENQAESAVGSDQSSCCKSDREVKDSIFTSLASADTFETLLPQSTKDLIKESLYESDISKLSFKSAKKYDKAESCKQCQCVQLDANKIEKMMDERLQAFENRICGKFDEVLKATLELQNSVNELLHLNGNHRKRENDADSTGDTIQR